MFAEDIILDIKSGVNVQGNMQELYTANLGLLHNICTGLQVPMQDREDFYQLAYFALHDAVAAYEPGGQHSFLAYYRRCLWHAYYVFQLQMKYPVRINQHVRSNVHKEYVLLQEGFIGAEEDKQYELIEDKIMSDLVWQEVRGSLDDCNADIVVRYYRDSCTYKEIGESYDICINSVRKRILRSLDKLRRNSVLREVAEDFYCIR